MQTRLFAFVPLLSISLFAQPAKPPKMARAPSLHAVTFGAMRRVPYVPPDITPDEKNEDTTTLKVRPLMVDGAQREWTTGELHEVTDRSFTIRRAMRLNDALASDKDARWVWQPGPWLLVDRVTGRITALHLPDFDPEVSNVVWYRDYAAYCGIATTARGGLFAIVAELGGRRAVVSKEIGPWPQANHFIPVCQPAEWQRMPMRVTIKPTGPGDAITFNVVGTSSLIEEGDPEPNQ
jgi:hypothetical protein